MGERRAYGRTLYRPGQAGNRAVAKAPRLARTVSLRSEGKVLLTGRSVGSKISLGPVRVVKHIQQLRDFTSGDILVTDKTDPDWEPVMKKASGIITNRGGRTCHAAIVSRELGVPAIVGTGNATEVLRDGQMVTLSCAEGDTGFVYEEALPFTVQRVELSDLHKTEDQDHDERRKSGRGLRVVLHPQ